MSRRSVVLPVSVCLSCLGSDCRIPWLRTSFLLHSLVHIFTMSVSCSSIKVMSWGQRQSQGHYHTSVAKTVASYVCTGGWSAFDCDWKAVLYLAWRFSLLSAAAAAAAVLCSQFMDSCGQFTAVHDRAVIITWLADSPENQPTGRAATYIRY